MKTHFETRKTESFKARKQRMLLNLYPAYRGTGARCRFLSDDYKEVHIRLPLNWRTRNYVGTIFGGSMYAALDPIYMVQLINILGKEYIVWDKSASIRFLRPGKSTLWARFLITEELISEIKTTIARENQMTIDLEARLVAASDNRPVAISSKTLFIANKKWYYERKKQKTAENPKHN